MRRLCLVVAGLCLLLHPLRAPLTAQETPLPDSTRPAAAFGWPEVRGFALTFAAGGLAYLADESARDASQRRAAQESSALGAVADFGNPYGSPGVLVLSAAMYGGGLVAKRPVVAASGLRGIEAIAVSGVVTGVLKAVAGRTRPDSSFGDHAQFKWMRGHTEGGNYRSLPSGHATAAFAFATAVHLEVKRRAPRHARWVGVVTYASAAASAYARMHDDRHWLSDVVVGAGIGSVTAAAIHRWHATRPADPIDGFFLRPLLQPRREGAAVGLSLSFR